VCASEGPTQEQLDENIATRNSLLANPYQPLLYYCMLAEGNYLSEFVPVYVQNSDVYFGFMMPEVDEEGVVTKQNFFKVKINEDGTLE
jgi:hypothetical protein